MKSISFPTLLACAVMIGVYHLLITVSRSTAASTLTKHDVEKIVEDEDDVSDCDEVRACLSAVGTPRRPRLPTK